MSSSVWLAFLAASLVISITPGPGALLSMSTGVRYGRAGAARTIAGLQIALLIQLSVVMAGVGAVLASSAPVFLAIKVIGAAYLFWLGVNQWRSPATPLAENLAPPYRRLFTQGILINLSNPKAIVFMAALVPQFIDPNRPALPQFGALALTTVGVDALVMVTYANTALRCRRWLQQPAAQRLQSRVFGGVFCTAGIILAGSSSHP